MLAAGAILPACAHARPAGESETPAPLDDFDEAAHITDHGVYAAKEILHSAFEGILYESDVISAISDAMISNGSDTTFAFDTIVASGEDSAIPHGDPSDDASHRIMPGDAVVVDLGARKNGCCADETLTFLMAPVSGEVRYVYDVVYRSHQAAVGKLIAGGSASDPDIAARQLIEDAGYGPHFIHSVGHGVGTAVHEAPTLSPGTTETLPDGKIVTVEPGIYIGGEFGIRTEDDYRITSSGSQKISFSPKTLDDAIIYPPISFGKAAFSIPDSAEIVVHDTGFNVNPSVKDTMDVDVSSTTETVPETLSLAETDISSGLFKGDIDIVSGTPNPDGKLQAADSDTITIKYDDPSPPKTRSATSIIDTCIPSVMGVSATPDVGSVVIRWDTGEPTNGTIWYGTTPSLGLRQMDFNLSPHHAVYINNLQPGTKYIFDISAWDEAGNMMRNDNSSSHYSFMTLDGVVSVPDYGYVGYVKSSEPSQNHFTSIMLLSGFSGENYLGAVQFNIPALPPGAIVLGADVSFYGVDWNARGSTGNWQLKLLNVTSDGGWASHGYSSISGASVDAVLVPALSNSDIGSRIWNAFAFSGSQLDSLRYHISFGKASFRIDGTGSLFFWATGYFWGSSGDFHRPVLTIRFSMPNPVPDVSLIPLVLFSIILIVFVRTRHSGLVDTRLDKK
jgi:hypothetical protein